MLCSGTPSWTSKRRTLPPRKHCATGTALRRGWNHWGSVRSARPQRCWCAPRSWAARRISAVFPIPHSPIRSPERSSTRLRSGRLAPGEALELGAVHPSAQRHRPSHTDGSRALSVRGDPSVSGRKRTDRADPQSAPHRGARPVGSSDPLIRPATSSAIERLMISYCWL